MGRVAGVLDDPPGFPYTPPGVDVLEGGKLTSNNVAGSSHDPLQSFAVASGVVSKPGGDVVQWCIFWGGIFLKNELTTERERERLKMSVKNPS